MQNRTLLTLDSVPFMVFLLFPFFEPVTISLIMPQLDRLINIWLIISMSITIIMFVRRNKLSTLLIAILVYFGFMIFSTYINSGNYISAINNYIPVVSFCLLTEMGVRRNCKTYFTSVFKIYYVLILFNFILLILFPDGIAVDNYYSNNTYNLLGIDNEIAIRVTIPLIMIAFLYSAFNGKRLTSSALLMITLISATALILWSATGIVAWFIELGLILYILYIRKKVIPRAMNIYVFYLIFIGLEILIIFLRRQSFLSFFIENILHKTLDFGRTVIWDRYLILIARSPIIGYGLFEGHGLVRNGSIMYGTHNAIIGLLVKGGIIGLLIYCIPFLLVAKKLFNMRGHYLSSIMMVCIFACLFVFLMEAHHDMFWVFGILIIAGNIESIIIQYDRR